jgi:hypothetical protein
MIPQTLTILFLGSAVLAQSAQFTTFGAGCTFQNQTLAIGNQGLPRLGTTFGITYSGPNYQFTSGQQIAQPMLVLGFTPQSVVLPANLLPQQVPNCTVLVAPLAIVPTVPDPSTNAFLVPLQLTLPNQPALLGLGVIAQWVTLFQQCGFAGCGYAAVLTSDAAIMTLGT